MGHSSPALQRPELSTFLITAHLQHPMNRTPRSSISAAPGHLHLMAQWALGTSTGTSQHRNTINAASPLAPCILPLRNTLFIIPVVHQTWPVLHMISCWEALGLRYPLHLSFLALASLFACWHLITGQGQSPLCLLLWAEHARKPSCPCPPGTQSLPSP